MTISGHEANTGERGESLSDMLSALAQDTSRERISVGELLTALGDRALGAMLFIFAFPNVLPTPPGTSTVLGAPLIFLAAQLAFGRKPWLPAVVAKRSSIPPGRMPAARPAARPAKTAKTSVTDASDNVAGSRALMAPHTDWLL